MERVGEVILIKNAESNTVKELLEQNAVLEKRHLQSEGDAGVSGPEVKPSPMLERKAEAIIPKECWGQVFKNLNAVDLLSCRQVCKTFKQVLDAKEFKQKWKFHLILPKLFPYLKKTYPHRWKPSWEHLYNARLVCRSWRHSIGKCAREVYGTRCFFPDYNNKAPLLTRFWSLEAIEAFQKRFGKCSTNPFPSRSVYIQHQDEGEEASEEGEDDDFYENYQNFLKVRKHALFTFCSKIGELLEQFGKHIFTLDLRFENKHLDPLTLCKFLKRITIHLPNLKELIMQGPTEEEEEVGEEEAISYVTESALAPLPKLRALNIERLNKSVLYYLLDANGPQLTQLKTTYNGYYLDTPNLFRFQMEELENVRKLWLELEDPRDTLKILRCLESPLKLLKLTYRHFSDPQTMNMDKLLRNLNHLPIELEIRLIFWGRSRVNVAAGIGKKEYNNASIKTLIIHIHQAYDNSDGQISFNFLRELTKLENLELKFSGQQLRTTHLRGLPEVVQLNEYLFAEQGTDLPYHSNVWEKVPTLKTLTLTWVRGFSDVFRKSIYTREKYESIIPC